jgi:hypothetical protein
VEWISAQVFSKRPPLAGDQRRLTGICHGCNSEIPMSQKGNKRSFIGVFKMTAIYSLLPFGDLTPAITVRVEAIFGYPCAKTQLLNNLLESVDNVVQTFL